MCGFTFLADAAADCIPRAREGRSGRTREVRTMRWTDEGEHRAKGWTGSVSVTLVCVYSCTAHHLGTRLASTP